jgi:hypothetical protein
MRSFLYPPSLQSAEEGFEITLWTLTQDFPRSRRCRYRQGDKKDREEKSRVRLQDQERKKSLMHTSHLG